MNPTQLIFAATCDLAGKLRGKAFPADQIKKRLIRGLGWTPTNIQITCFDVIAESPFGALGDLLLIPDASAEARVELGEGHIEHLMLADVTDLDGEPWDLCTRSILKTALGRLNEVASVRLLAAFEHEFQLMNPPLITNEAYGREGFERQRQLCERLMAALQENGIGIDSIMKEYGPSQFEVVVDPEIGVRAADVAVIVRALTRSVARSIGDEATFTPIRDISSVGNGVHIHMSLLDEAEKPATFDENGAHGLSELAGSFAAGILKYLENILALTAPSVISYERLTPHRWSAAYNNLGFRDREASLRICPVTSKDPSSTERQFNLEFRAGDAAASPYLALAAIVHAGVQGIEEGLAAPQATQEDLSLLSDTELSARGFSRLPTTLEAALDRFESSATVKSWFPDMFSSVYRAHKQAEIAHVSGMTIEEKRGAYANTY